MRNERAWPQQCWKSCANGSNIIALPFGDHGTKEMLGVVGCKVWPVSSPVQTDATLLANNSQYCWMLHVTSVCTPCCMLMSVVGSCCEKCEAGQTFSHVQTNATNPNIVGPTLERLSIAFTANGKREFVPRDQCCLLFIDYTKIARFTPILSRIIVLSCFYLLISHCENFLTWISRLPFAVNAMLNLSNVCLLYTSDAADE